MGGRRALFGGLMKNKSLFSLLLTLVLLAPPAHAQRVNVMITFAVTGTPQRLVTQSTPENRLLLQSRHSNVGLITIMLGIPTKVACSTSATTPSQITAELGPGDALHPGNSLSDPQGANGSSPPDFEDLALACAAGTAGDQLIVSFWQRN